jgi:hypothetical protein
MAAGSDAAAAIAGVVLAIPPSVLECVRGYDSGIDPMLKREWSPTGILVFARP